MSVSRQARHEWIVVGALTFLVGAVLRVDLVGIDSVPAGGDATAHVLWANEMRRVIAEGRTSGWSMDWFAGFPVGAAAGGRTF